MLFAFSKKRLTEIHTGGRNNSVDYAQAESAEQVRLKKSYRKLSLTVCILICS